MADYIDSTELRAYIGSDTTNFESLLATVCTVASRTVEQMCERIFFADGSPSPRYFHPDSYWSCKTDDIATTSGLIVQTDDGGDGTYSATWDIEADFFLEPINQRRGGIAGWPYDEIVALSTRQFFRSNVIYRRPIVKVTAAWGWAAVPDNVTQACLLGAARLFKMKDAPDGFIGVAGWGPVQMKRNPEVRELLAPFMKSPVATA